MRINLSHRVIRDALSIKISHLSIYEWMIRFFSFFFLVDWNSKKIVA